MLYSRTVLEDLDDDMVLKFSKREKVKKKNWRCASSEDINNLSCRGQETVEPRNHRRRLVEVDMKKMGR